MTTPRLLIALGICIALALLALATLDLGDPGAAARGRLVREADTETRSALTAWAERLSSEAPLGASIGPVERWTWNTDDLPAGLLPFEGREAERDDAERALLVLARDHAARGRLDVARETLERVFEAQPGAVAALAPAARLESLRLARAAEDSAALARHFAAAEAWSFDLALDGASARLLASLAAGPALAPDTRARVAEDVRTALAEGRLRVGAADGASRGDRLVIDEGGARVVLDAGLTALRAALETRLPLTDDTLGWRRAFAEDARRSAVLKAALARSAGADSREDAGTSEGANVIHSADGPLAQREAWRCIAADALESVSAGSGAAGSGAAGSGAAGSGAAGSGTAGSGTAGSGTAGSGTAGSGTAGSGTADSVPAGSVLAVRSGDFGAVVLHTEHALEDALAAAVTGPWSVVFGADPKPPAEVFGLEHTLPGWSRTFRVAHADPGALVAGERQRLLVIRGALVALALAIAGATLAAASAARRAARLSELRRTFVASISHDLRTPLASISNLAENLADGVVAGEHALREYHAAIRREAARLGRLVDGLLDFARLERGEAPRVRTARVDSAEWLHDLERAARAVCEPHGVEFRFVPAPLDASLWIDADAVHRAALNLVENAVRHSGSDVVTLRIATEGDPGARALVVEVEDRGRGLPGAAREDLFAAYACAGEAAGTGLGLTIVRSIAVAHGGQARLTRGADGVGVCATLSVALGAAEHPTGSGVAGSRAADSGATEEAAG